MNKEKDEEVKKLQVRLPNDEYVKLKYLAAHHGNSLNAEFLAAINLAERKARETGLYIPVTELSPKTKSFRDGFVSPFQEMLDTYYPSQGIGKSPVETVRQSLDDWLLAHAELRGKIFQLGLVIESMDRLIRSLRDPQHECFLKLNVGDKKSEVITALENLNGLPALRKTYQSYLELVEKILPKMKNVELVQQGLNSNLHHMHKSAEHTSSTEQSDKGLAPPQGGTGFREQWNEKPS